MTDKRELQKLSVDELIDSLTPDQVESLLTDVDPDDSSLPPSMRTTYHCDKQATKSLDRDKLAEFLNKQALAEPDIPDRVPYVPGTVRGKKWEPPTTNARKGSTIKSKNAALAASLASKYGLNDGSLTTDAIEIDIEDDEPSSVDSVKKKINCDEALSRATTADIVDLAGILGMHEFLNQDQVHAAQSPDKFPRADENIGFHGVTKASPLKEFPDEGSNTVDPEEVISKLQAKDATLTEVNLNNIPLTKDIVERLCRVLATSGRHVSSLSLANCQLTDGAGQFLVDLITAHGQDLGVRKLNVESNLFGSSLLVSLIKASINIETLTEVRFSNQKSAVVGHQAEMALAKAVEESTTLLRVGLPLQFGDCRNRVDVHLQKNMDRVRLARLARNQAGQGSLNQG